MRFHPQNTNVVTDETLPYSTPSLTSLFFLFFLSVVVVVCAMKVFFARKELLAPLLT